MSVKDRKEYYAGIKAERKNTIVVACLTGLLTLSIGGGVGYFLGARNTNSDLDPYAQKLIDAYNVIKENWLYSGEDIESIIVDGMLSDYFNNDSDPYTIYTKDQASQGLDTTGVGFGASFSNYYGDIIVNSVHNGSFKKAGIKAGDIIEGFYKNNGSYIYPSQMNFIEARSLLSGVHGDTFGFRIRRDGDIANFDSVPIEQFSETTIFLVNDEVVDGKRCVEVKINTFLGDPTTELKVVLDTLLNDGAIDVLLLDLKNNGGGYVHQMNSLSSFFVPKGTTIYSMTNNKGEVIEKKVQNDEPRYKEDQIKDIRIVQNGGSASASESFTLALKDTDVATVYGTTSYGKGIAQTFFTFSDKSVLRYTYASISGPGGYSIQDVGIVPDVTTDQSYNLLSSSFIYNADGISNYYGNIQAQLQFHGYTGSSFSELLTNFQTANSLTVTGTYDKATYDFLSGLNYDKYQELYSLENYNILTNE